MKKFLIYMTLIIYFINLYSQQDNELQKILHSYTEEINKNQRYVDQAYIDRILDREEVLIASLQDHKKISYTFHPNKETVNFMKENDSNEDNFHNKSCLLIQHLITKEIINILESSIKTIRNNPKNSALTDLCQHNCNLAIAAQQLNQQNQIALAIILTDCCHFFALYGESILNNNYNYDTQSLNITTDNIGAFLYTYVAFAERLYNAPKIILNELVSDFKNISQYLHNILDEINQNDSQKNKNSFERENRLVDNLQHCKESIKKMNEQLIQENNIETISKAKMKASLLFLCTSTYDHLQETRQTIQKIVPQNALKEPIGFTKTSDQKIIVLIESTNEIINPNKK